MRIERAQRMEMFQPAIFGRLREKASRVEGIPLIDLSLGSPDIPPAAIVTEALAEASRDPRKYGYTLGGTARFHEAVAHYYRRRAGVAIDPGTEVLQTMGSQEGLVHLPMAFCDPGDIVLTTNPAYVAYETGIRLAGAIPHAMPLRAERQFLPDLSAVREEVAERAKLLILNMPGNPVPAEPTRQFFEEVIAFAKRYNILVVHDAAYSEFYYGDEPPISFLAVDGAKEVGIETNSLSKSFSLAGARIAYFVGNREALSIMRELKTNLDYGVFEPIQEAAVVALDHAEAITEPLRDTFRRRHAVVTAALHEMGWDVAPSSSGMFVWAKYPSAVDDETFAFDLIERVGILVVPGSAFGTEGEGYVRIALVQNEDVLREAMTRLRTLFVL